VVEDKYINKKDLEEISKELKKRREDKLKIDVEEESKALV
jgi:hypothetical protein